MGHFRSPHNELKNITVCYAASGRLEPLAARAQKKPLDPHRVKRRYTTAVPLLFLTQKAGNGAKPEGICIPLAPGRTFPSLPVGRLAVGGLPSLSGSAGGTLPVPREMKFSHPVDVFNILPRPGPPCQAKPARMRPGGCRRNCFVPSLIF